MTYQPYLIANFATGVTTRLQPWLNPDDAQEVLFDGFVYRGVMGKRNGYQYYAYGLSGGAPYCESRIVNRTSLEPVTSNGVATGTLVQGNGTTGPYTFILQNLPIRRGTVSIITANPSSPPPNLILTDNGLGVFSGDGSGTINYTTGVVTVSFSQNIPMSQQIFATYDNHPGYPVLGIMTFVSATNEKRLLVADGRYINIYDRTTNTLQNINPTVAIDAVGGITNANPGVVTTASAHNLVTGDKVRIYGVLGMPQVNNQIYQITVLSGTTFSIVDTSGFGAYVSGGTIELVMQGNITFPASSFYSWTNYPDKDDNPRLIFTNNNGEIMYYAPHLSPSIGDYMNYPNAVSPDFKMETSAAIPAPVTSITCLELFVVKDRLCLLRTTESGTIYPRRIRISGTGTNCDNFLTTATGAGFIDMADQTWIFGADLNRDDLEIFTEACTWLMKYTGNDTTPFVLDRLDASRGSQAPFAAFTYLNRTSAASPRGLIISDGYRVERQDESIPDFSFNQIDGTTFNLCFAGVVDADRDHYLLYPPPNQVASTEKSLRILTTNYDEDNYSIYRIPLSCMGTYISSKDITWNDLLIYDNWEQFGQAYANWNSFTFNSGAPFSLGGGHYGEIWMMDVNEAEDNVVRIYNITVIDSQTLQVTTDWNNFQGPDTYDQEMGADYIYFDGISGMVGLNKQQCQITQRIDFYTFNVYIEHADLLGTYTSGGTAVRVIPFTSVMKKFNPFVGTDKKVRCGWLYMYVSTSGTSLKENNLIASITQSATPDDPTIIFTIDPHELNNGDQVFLFDIGGMVELNDNFYFITVLTPNSFILNGVDSSGYTPYTSGGYAQEDVKAKMEVQITVNDNAEFTQLNSNAVIPYQGTISNLYFEDGEKKWYKIFINQTGRFIQFTLKNVQAGTKVDIQALMPGFQPVGRII